MRRLILPLLLLAAAARGANVAQPPHSYWEREPRDRFARVMAEVAAGRLALDPSGEKELLASLLRALDIPDSSQLLVYSATSIQSERINPRNPRGLYFNEDTFVGYVPGGRLEVASLDPEAGMVFYIFDRLTTAAVPRFVRSDRCMNCHADTPSFRRPGLVVHSVAVTWDGSSQETYRYDEMGHTVPLDVRFGGWHLTGGHGLARTHANLIGDLTPNGLVTEPNPPGKNFDLRRYPRPTSDILVHLVHEHQVGFVNRVVQSVYLARENPTVEQLDAFADDFTAYILFDREAPLPAGGVRGDPDFVRDFRARDPARGPSLRDFDLRERIFKHRASFMVETPVWSLVPDPIRTRVLARLDRALAPAGPASEKFGIGVDEKRAIRDILCQSLSGFPLNAGGAAASEPQPQPARSTDP